MNKRRLKCLDLDRLDSGGPRVTQHPDAGRRRLCQLPDELVAHLERLAELLERYGRDEAAGRRRPS